MVRAAGRERGKKKGGGRKSSVIRELTAALLFPLLTPCAVHHSACDDRSGGISNEYQLSYVS